MELTLADVQTYLKTIGIVLPDFMVQIFLEQADSIDECLALNYSPGVAKLIKLYLIGLMGLPAMDKYVSSHSAPSGASESYRYGSFADRWRSGYSLLSGLDPKGCATALIPPDPLQTANAAFFVVGGGCRCE